MIKNKLMWLQAFSGIVGVLILWTGVVAAMRNAHLGLIDARPISYLGVNPPTAAIFSGSLLISSFLFLNFSFYVQRRFHVQNKFMFYFLIGQAGQVIAAVTPYGNKSNFKLIHTIAAYVLAFSLPLLIRQFAISQSSQRHHKLCVSLLRIEQMAFIIGIGLFAFTKGIAPLGEAMPAIGFHIWIIAVTYTDLVTKSRMTPSAPNISKT